MKLGDCIQTLKGYAFKSQWYADKGVPLVKVSNFTDDSIDTGGLIFIPDEIAKDYIKYEVKTGDVIIQTVGSWPTNPQSVVGKVIKVPARANGALLNQNAVKVQPDNRVDKKYLYYLLKADTFKNYIVGCAQGAASQASITLDAIRAYSFQLPTKDTQCCIAAILSAYDDLIENNMRRIQILEEMARQIYEEWFVWLRFPGHETSKIVETVEGQTPEGWQRCTLSDIAEDKRESIEPDAVEPETPYVGLEHIPRRSIALCEWGAAKDVQSTKLLFKEGDILFGKIRPYFHKVAVAPVDGMCSSDAIVITAKQQELFPLVLATVSSDDFVLRATQTSNGAKMPRANWPVLLKYSVLIAPEPLQKQFNEYIKNSVALIRNLSMKNRNLRRTRDLLLPRLISGEINVSHFPYPDEITS